MDGESRPLLRVVRGEPSAEEAAALVVVLASYAAAGEPAVTAIDSGWTDKRRALRRPVSVGPGAWLVSGWEKGLRTRADW